MIANLELGKYIGYAVPIYPADFEFEIPFVLKTRGMLAKIMTQ